MRCLHSQGDALGWLCLPLQGTWTPFIERRMLIRWCGKVNDGESVFKSKNLTAKTLSSLSSRIQVQISCLPLRSWRLGGENVFILLRFLGRCPRLVEPAPSGHKGLAYLSSFAVFASWRWKCFESKNLTAKTLSSLSSRIQGPHLSSGGCQSAGAFR